jgi:hypothetical protein
LVHLVLLALLLLLHLVLLLLQASLSAWDPWVLLRFAHRRRCHFCCC